jgi:hypothetical protein
LVDGLLANNPLGRKTAKPRLWRVAPEEFHQGRTTHLGRQAEGFIMIPALDVCGN